MFQCSGLLLKKPSLLSKKQRYNLEGYLSKRLLRAQRNRPGVKLYEARPNIPGVIEVESNTQVAPSGNLPPAPPFGIHTDFDFANEKRAIETRQKFRSLEGERPNAEQYPTEEHSIDDGRMNNQVLDPVAQRALSIAEGRRHQQSLIDTTGGFREQPPAPILYRDELQTQSLVPPKPEGALDPQRWEHSSRWTDDIGSSVVAREGEAPLATTSFGNTTLSVKKATEFHEPVNLHVLKHARSDADKANTARLPRHLNSLYHKILGWSKDLDALDDSTGIIEEGKSPDASKADPQLKAERVKEKLKYGVLMENLENDRFALTHKLEVAGEKFDQEFKKWETIQMLRDEAPDALSSVREQKSSVVTLNMGGLKIPKMDRDPCPGCGATFQCADEQQFGYLEPGAVEKWLRLTQARLHNRATYAQRMAELKKHWDTHGKRVGEEWLDFMTEPEFKSIYLWNPTPIVCSRCQDLKNFGTDSPEGAVLQAEDFSAELAKLKEQKCVIVLVIDLSDFPGTMVLDLPGLISMNNPVIIAANKLDVVTPVPFDYRGKFEQLHREKLPRGHIPRWVRGIATQFGLPDSVIKAVVPVSARKRWYIEELVEAIEREANLNLARPGPILNTYFVGVTNVGKSTLLNSVASMMAPEMQPHPRAKKQYYTFTDESGKEHIQYQWHVPKNAGFDEAPLVPLRQSGATVRRKHQLLTTSTLPGTTVKATGIPVAGLGGKGKQTFFFDTPGLYPHWVEGSILSVRDQLKCLQTRIKPFTGFLVRQGMTLFFGGIAAVDVVNCPETGLFFCCYHSQHVKLKLCNQETAEEEWAESLDQGALFPPASFQALGTRRLSVKKSYMFECFSGQRKKPKADIYFCGLGYLSFYCSAQHDVVLRVRTLPGVIHGVREPLRIKDMAIYKPWPKDRNKLRRPERAKKLVDIVQVTAGPYDPNAPPIREVSSTPTESKRHHGDAANEEEDEAEGLSDTETTRSSNSESGAEPTTVPDETHKPFEHIMEILQRQGKLER
jgi:hypothetical protein